MKSFEERIYNMQENNTTAKPARKVRKRTVAAIILTAAVFAGTLTVIGVFGKKMSKTAVSADRLSAVTNMIEVKQEKATAPASTCYQYFAPAQNGSSRAWNLVKGGDLVEVNANYDNADHIYRFEFKGKEKGTGDIELSYQVKENKIKTDKLRLTVDENMNVSKVN